MAAECFSLSTNVRERKKRAFRKLSQSVIEKNRETIFQLKHENENIRKKLAEGEEQVTKDVFQDRGMENASLRNMSVKPARTVLEKEVCDKMKKLNAIKQTTDTQRQRLEELKRQYESMKPLPDNQELDEEKKLRILENRLEEAQLKRHEAKNVMRGYLKVKDKLQEDSLTFEPQLDRMEAEIHRQTQVLKELKVTNGDAHFSKDAAMAELQLQDEQVCRERRRREKILSRYKKQEEKRIAQAKEMKRRASIIHHTSDNNLPDELSSEAKSSASAVEEVEAISPFEEAFQQIREATGVTDPRMKGPTPQLTLDSEEQKLQLMSEAEQKLMLLKEELQGKDLATILKEIEEEEVRNND
ncbi:unnamed protein product [Leuciscus chuanchicus]